MLLKENVKENLPEVQLTSVPEIFSDLQLEFT